MVVNPELADQLLARVSSLRRATSRRSAAASPIGSLDALDRFQPPGSDRVHELLVVVLVLVGVALARSR